MCLFLSQREAVTSTASTSSLSRSRGCRRVCVCIDKLWVQLSNNLHHALGVDCKSLLGGFLVFHSYPSVPSESHMQGFIWEDKTGENTLAFSPWTFSNLNGSYTQVPRTWVGGFPSLLWDSSPPDSKVSGSATTSVSKMSTSADISE